MSQTYDINYTTKQKLVNLNYQINKFIVEITKKQVPRTRFWRWSTISYYRACFLISNITTENIFLKL